MSAGFAPADPLPSRYPPSSPGSRATLLSLIVAAHVLAIVALVSARVIAVTIEKAPMRVEILPEPPKPRPPVLVPALPAPQLRKPDIHIPDPPRFEVIQAVEVVEKPVAPPPAPPKAVVAQVAVPEAVALEPPRFDLAYLDNPAPAYPVFAKRAREQGKVLLRVRVDAAGRVEGIELEKSSGSERLDAAALAAVKRWKFAPARKGGQAVAGVALVPINFQLET